MFLCVGKHPRDSLHLIDTFGLYHAVFTDPTRPESVPKPKLLNWKATYDCLHDLSQNNSPGSVYSTLVCTEEAAHYAWVLAAVVPFEQVCEPPETRRPSKALPAPTLAAREGIKANNKLCDVITMAHYHRHDISKLKEAVCLGKDFIRQRDRFGMAIRQWDSRGGQWRLQVLYAILSDVLEAGEAAGRETVVREWQQFLDHLQDIDVMAAPNLKRIVDGTQLSRALGVKPGKWMAQALDVVMEWQLRNPGETDPASAIEAIRKQRDRLGIPET
jgi:tRNA nucleotidyltransferase (CCA-adding enzyme)